ncbi:MAG: efflux RND transporter permease subunit [Kiritimatiellales bacterium]|nr:efflux RND transporter permease subunit [Kiritimatiellota bacterium]MBL7012118.1 efflux RND transporter permease subunit [Kiritimatiellales bacterium]
MKNNATLSGRERRGPIAWMTRNSVAANIVMLVLILGGLIQAFNVKQEFLPSAELDFVTVSVPYPGASPEEVEQAIVLAVEEAVRGLDGVEEVTSSAREGSGTVTVEVMAGHDMSRLSQEIQSEVDRIRTFPEDAEEPTVSVSSLRREVLTVIVSADTADTVLREVAEQVRERLILSPGITQVEMSNVRSYEIAIEIPQDTLRAHNLTLSDVADTLSRASVETPGGGMKTDSGEILVRVRDRRDYGEQFGRIPVITGADGTQVLLEDIATIRDRFDDSDRFTYFNGKPALTMSVYRVGKETPVSVDEATKQVLEELRATLPEGIEMQVWNSRADMFRERMNLLLRNGLLGLILVFIVLGFFLEMRLAFWVMMGIPISFLGTILIMPAMGLSINMVSMFAFILALGIVVDDAIVVGENIYHNHQEGMPFLRAAIVGARQIAMPVTFSILTNIVAFMPLYFVPGVMGKFFSAIPLVVCSTFVISLVEALFVLPAHLGHQKDLKSPHALHRLQQRFGKAFMRFVREKYAPFLDRTLRRRYLTVAVGLFVLILTISHVKSGRMGFELFPSVESDVALCTFKLPYGSPVEKTQEVHDRIIRAGQELVEEIEAETGRPQIKGYISYIGTGDRGVTGGHSGSITFDLVDADVRPVSTEDFVERWRKKAGAITGIDTVRYRADSGGPGGSSDALTVELSHRDISVLEQASADLAAQLSEYSIVSDIDDGFTPGKPQIDFKLKPEGRSLGLTSASVARQVRNAYYGAEAIRQQRGRNEVKVMLRLPEAERATEFSLESMILRTPSSHEVPLREVVSMERGRAYTTISRRNGRRTVTVSANVTPKSKADLVLADMKGGMLTALKEKYPGLSYSFEGSQADQRESVQGLINGLLGAILLIYIILAIPFKSYSQPLIIMVSIPFGIVGAVIGHMLMGYSLSVISIFGIVALSGVVVNDSLVLIDFFNQKRREGMSVHDSVMTAGVQRFRPIVLTTLTTFGGLLPMIFETSRQARFLIPMAISLGFGILFATGITLLLIPSLTMILEDISRLFKRES